MAFRFIILLNKITTPKTRASTPLFLAATEANSTIYPTVPSHPIPFNAREKT